MVKQLKDLTPADIEQMDYNNIISVVRETNRAPGGYATIQEVVNATGLKASDSLLEIGTSTGISAIEFVRLSNCHIEAIDINERSLEEARERARPEGLDARICFSIQNAMALDFAERSFDVVFCGNVTSLIPDREAARSEYVRVLKNGGILAAVPMYYIKTPSQELLGRVRDAIQVDIEVQNRDYWVSFYKKSGLVLKYLRNFMFDYIPDQTLEEFISYILAKKHLTEMRPDTFAVLEKKYREYIYLFRDNLSHMGYSIILLTKEAFNDEPELFTGTEIFD